jgi:streptogrisin C
MRRIAAILTAALAILLTVTTPAAAAPSSIGGGSVLFNGILHCTAAFAARNGPTGYLVTGPGCAGAPGTQLFSGNNILVGPVVSSTANGGVTVVHVANTAAWQLVSWIRLGGVNHPITGSVSTPVGGSVCLLDGAMGVGCGTVMAKNQTVNYPGGIVFGLTRTNVCISARSAIAFVTGSQAQGVPMGGTSGCTSGGTSFFYPINTVLAAYGLTLFTG